jgi:hypothetical protein
MFPTSVRGDPRGEKKRRGDGDVELFPGGEFCVAILSPHVRGFVRVPPTRDGNADLIPNSPRRIPPLEDEDGEETSSVGYKRENFILRRKNGDGDGEAFPIPVSREDPLNLHVTMFLCNS